jgi:hypothetical protein
MDDKSYRQALGCFATGVAVVTTRTAQGVSGITINSFTSVSLKPRLVLWCLDDRSDRYAAFAEAETWGLSILAPEHEEIASRLAGRGAHALEPGETQDGAGGAPVLNDALAHLACRRWSATMMGDHLVLAGEVLGFASRVGHGLTYFRGRYGLATHKEA